LIQDGLGLRNNVVRCTAGDGMRAKAVHA
jgi:hypothetical protein